MDLEWLRKDAKALRRGFASGDPASIVRAEHVLGVRARERFGLSDAQHVVAVEHGYRTWPELRRRAAAVPVPLEQALYLGDREAADEIAERTPEPLALWTAAALGRLDLLARVHGTREAATHRPDLARAGWPPAPPASHDEQTVVDEALCFASINGRDEAIEWLLDHGADVNGAPYLGMTPLHFAVAFSRPSTVRLLLESGADRVALDEIRGRVPAAWARGERRRMLAGLIDGIETTHEYGPGKPVHLRVDFRRFPYVLDGGRAVELGGRPDGWRAAAERIARDRIVNVSRSGVVSLPVVRGGPGFDAIVERIADASVELYEGILELDG
ncbi:MAG TPA: ankyrin repeat domain-containing protein [Gaiellaceae bacterium]|nr:ankyrin repeat domain-containing protein [Gaiellaceae bacterium]